MAGRNRLPPQSSLARAIPERHITHHHLEDRISIQHREIQSLLLHNQRLAATYVALKQDLALAQQELRHLCAAAANVKAERDAEVREVYERSLKMNAEARAVDSMSAELAHVRADVQKFAVDRQELTAQLEAVNNELAKARAETKQAAVIKAEMEAVRQEIHKGRSAIELEKKTHASDLEQRQILEKNIILVTREREKLHAELASAEKKARAAAAANPSPAYNGNYKNVDTKYGGSSYPDTYSMPLGGSGPESVPGTRFTAAFEGQGSHTPYENQTSKQFVPNSVPIYTVPNSKTE
ncbi:PREDICTED: protein FLC EXPRESSOR [Theobroma cacao]|uniref:Protein FLC EXPRESSOR n=1 Tax=Theobroma cacao TaxID=3641 RepID=A0AB32USY9_THECC|nr:PREDICTED: protein FLC EXPRESSOR [Theobroma cacao]